jgi:hypothetical protein
MTHRAAVVQSQTQAQNMPRFECQGQLVGSFQYDPIAAISHWPILDHARWPPDGPHIVSHPLIVAVADTAQNDGLFRQVGLTIPQVPALFARECGCVFFVFDTNGVG